MWPSDDSGGWFAVPENFCGICGVEVPEGQPHCSAACAAESAAILAAAKGVA